MKEINLKGRKLNLFDWIVLVLIIAVVAAVALYIYASQSGGNKCEVTFTVEFKEVDENFVNIVSESHIRGDEIKDSIKGYSLGNAYAVETQPDMVINFDETERKFVEVELPGRYRVYLTVRGTGTETDDSLYLDGQPIKVGNKMSLKGKGYAQSGYVTDVYATKLEGGLFR